MAAVSEVEAIDAYQSCDVITAALVKAQEDLARYRSQIYNLEGLLINSEQELRKDSPKSQTNGPETEKIFFMQKLQSVLNAQVLLQQQVRSLQEQMGKAPASSDSRAKIRTRSKAVVNQVSEMQSQMRSLQHQISGLGAQKGLDPFAAQEKEAPKVGTNNNNSERNSEEHWSMRPAAENFRSLTKQIQLLRSTAEAYLDKAVPADPKMDSASRTLPLFEERSVQAFPTFRGNWNNVCGRGESKFVQTAGFSDNPPNELCCTKFNQTHWSNSNDAFDENNANMAIHGDTCFSKQLFRSPNLFHGDQRTEIHTAKLLPRTKVSITRRSQTHWTSISTSSKGCQWSHPCGSAFKSQSTQVMDNREAKSSTRSQTEPVPTTTVASQSDAANTRSRAVQYEVPMRRKCNHCGAISTRRPEWIHPATVVNPPTTSQENFDAWY